MAGRVHVTISAMHMHADSFITEDIMNIKVTRIGAIGNTHRHKWCKMDFFHTSRHFSFKRGLHIFILYNFKTFIYFFNACINDGALKASKQLSAY